MTTRRPASGTREGSAKARLGKRTARRFWDELARANGAAAAIDPADRHGLKNKYISVVRDLALKQALSGMRNDARILDYGCGSGTFLSEILDTMPDQIVTGLDISSGMLKHAVHRDSRLRGKVTVYDGLRLPIGELSLDVVTTSGALLYLVGKKELEETCKEFNRVLRPGGVVACIEQVRGREHYDERHMKVQRTPDDLIAAFRKAGFALRYWRQVRRGHFPIVYLIRYGLVPSRWLSLIARFEAKLWGAAALPRLDYADSIFVFDKPAPEW